MEMANKMKKKDHFEGFEQPKISKKTFHELYNSSPEFREFINNYLNTTSCTEAEKNALSRCEHIKSREEVYASKEVEPLNLFSFIPK